MRELWRTCMHIRQAVGRDELVREDKEERKRA